MPVQDVGTAEAAQDVAVGGAVEHVVVGVALELIDQLRDRGGGCARLRLDRTTAVGVARNHAHVLAE
ncbi:hypothetical protein D9M71_192060 [compost metagenome]